MDTSHPAGTRWRSLGLGITAAASAAVIQFAAPASATARSGPASPEVTVVAQFAPGSTNAASVAAAATGRTARAEPAGRYVAVVPASQATAVVARLQAQPGVRYAEVAHAVHAMDLNPTDPCYSTGCLAGGSATPVTERYLQTIGAPQAWSVSTGSGVRVAVLDTGVDPTQPDLRGGNVGGAYPDNKIVSQTNVCGTDPQCGDSNQNDDAGHGTHVTGILAGITNNGVGVAALGWNVKVDAYKVLDQNGNGFTADVDTAIYDAVARGDRVINLSLANYSCQQSPGDCGPDPDEQTAVEYALSHNVVVVAAAGNGPGGPGDNGLTYPASYPGVLAVAATDDRGVVAPYSQWGPAANIAAPGDEINPNPDGSGGVGIVSTWIGGGYALDVGTSMSTPQVSAAAALVIAYRPALSAQQVTEILESSAGPTRGGRPINGGLLNVPAALTAAGQAPTSYLGYVMAGANGSAYSFGSVGAFGNVAGAHLAKPIVGVAMVPNGLGYWMVASDGGLFSFGSARFLGSTGGVTLNKPVVGMAPTPDGRGYWMVASDGGVFAFGDARFFGSTGGITLNKPVVGLARTTDGRGYWMAASDGGIFAFGDARFHGSTGNVTLARPVVGMSATPNSGGYWLAASDGGVFNFGNARFYGSAGGAPIPGPVVGVAS